MEDNNGKKRTENNKNKNGFENIDVKKFIAIIIPVFASSVLTIAFAFSVLIHSDQREIDGSLGIISLAVAVWTGINIANTLEKSEVEKIRGKLIDVESKIEKTEEIVKKSEAIDQDLDNNKKMREEIDGIIEKSEGIIKDLNENKQLREDLERKEFLYVLESSDDIFYRHLRDLFIKEKQLIPPRFNADTLRIIKGILHIRNLHEKNDSDAQIYICEYSKELINRIDELVVEIPTGLTSYVLKFIRSEALFYSAFAKDRTQNDQKKFLLEARLFYEAAKGYEAIMHTFVDGSDSIIEMYYYNTVAQCYNEIIFCYERSRKNRGIASEIDRLVNINDAKDLVLKYSYLATADRKLEDYPFSYERYYKNSGVAKERIAQLNGEFNIPDLKEAIEDYEKAAKYSQQNKTGFVLCSAYNKIIKAMIYSDEGKMDFITDKCADSVWLKGKIAEQDMDYFKYAYKRLRGLSNRWRQINPAEPRFYCFYILSQIYEGVIADNDQKRHLLDKVRPDVEEINLKPDDIKNVLDKVVVNVFNRINNDFS